MQIDPFTDDSRKSAAFDRSTPGHRLSTDESGLAWSHGHAATYPPDVPSTAVMVSKAALASFGTPLLPAMRTSSGVEPSAEYGHFVGCRVSMTRAGDFTRSSLALFVQPNESTMMSVATDAIKHRSPPASATNARFATVSPARKVTVDESVDWPHG